MASMSDVIQVCTGSDLDAMMAVMAIDVHWEPRYDDSPLSAELWWSVPRTAPRGLNRRRVPLNDTAVNRSQQISWRTLFLQIDTLGLD